LRIIYKWLPTLYAWAAPRENNTIMSIEKWDVSEKLDACTSGDEKKKLARKYIKVHSGVESHKQFALIENHIRRANHTQECTDPDCLIKPLNNVQKLYMDTGGWLYKTWTEVNNKNLDGVISSMAKYKEMSQEMMFNTWENVENDIPTSIGVVSDIHGNNLVEDISGEEAYRRMCDYEKKNLESLEEGFKLAIDVDYFEN